MASLLIIRDRQTGQEFEAPAGTPFDRAQYFEVTTPESAVRDTPLQHLGEKPSARSMLATLARVGGPMAIGAATGGAGAVPALLAMIAGSAGSEAAAEGIEGTPLNPTAIGTAGAVGAAGPGLSRLARGLTAAGAGALRRGGILPNLFQSALETAAQEGTRIPTTALKAANQEVAARAGTPAIPQGVGPLTRNITNRTQGPDLSLKEADDVRQMLGDVIPSRSLRGSAERLYGGVSEDIRAAKGAPGVETYLQGLSEERALNALVNKFGLRELLASGIFGQVTSAGYFTPVLNRILGAAKAIPPNRLATGATVGVGNALSDALRSP